MDLLVPEVVSLISKLGAMMVLIKARFMSLCHSLEERMALWQPTNNVKMTCTGGKGHALSDAFPWGAGHGTLRWTHASEQAGKALRSQGHQCVVM